MSSEEEFSSSYSEEEESEEELDLDSDGSKEESDSADSLEISSEETDIDLDKPARKPTTTTTGRGRGTATTTTTGRGRGAATTTTTGRGRGAATTTTTGRGRGAATTTTTTRKPTTGRGAAIKPVVTEILDVEKEVAALQKARGETASAFAFRKDVFEKILFQGEYNLSDSLMYANMLTNMIHKGILPTQEDKKKLEEIIEECSIVL